VTKTIVPYKKILFTLLITLYFSTGITSLYAQKRDSLTKASSNPAMLLQEDTSNFEDKFMISELEKVQYARYSEDLKKVTLEKLLENQKLQNISLQQKLQNQKLKTEAERKQVEAERIKAEADRQQDVQNQKIKQLEITELQQRLTLQKSNRNFLYIGLALLTLLGISLLWSNRQLKKRNKAIQNLSEENIEKEQEKQLILSTQNETLEKQVTERTNALTNSLKELKETQTQLIQKEKLASLGELTAGIAHEIQNPLNFVNNFSELSVDLAKELNEEMDKETIDKDFIKELMVDLTSNQEKINHHGKRASSIVKGMLEHSRASTGVKEMTDINALADEYFRLSYHGLRAKDKDFNATMETDFDKNLPKINVIPQDLGRVILNLFNNAFYAVHQRQQLSESLKLSESYTPSVFLTTQLIDNQIVIKVRDNGTGMPESVRAKVFQPFFTTKPTGSGTGLGLSLAYDIVTKGHGGILEVISKENEFTEFMIKLPL
jgi:signal transduction histidine kinase